VKQTFVGATDWVLDLATSPDGTTLLAACQDNMVHLHDITTVRCLGVLSGHRNAVLAITLTSDGSHVLSASLDGTVRQWDLQRAELVSTSHCHSTAILALHLTDIGFVTGSRDCTAAHWQLQGTNGAIQIVEFRGHTRWVNATAVNGQQLFTGSSDMTARQWNLATGKHVCTYSGHTHEVIALQIQDGAFLFTASRDSSARKYAIATGACLMVFDAHFSAVRDICLHNDMLFTASADGSIKCWQSVTGQCLCNLVGNEGSVVTSLTISQGCLFVGFADHQVRQFLIQDIMAATTGDASKRVPSLNF